MAARSTAIIVEATSVVRPVAKLSAAASAACWVLAISPTASFRRAAKPLPALVAAAGAVSTGAMGRGAPVMGAIGSIVLAAELQRLLGHGLHGLDGTDVRLVGAGGRHEVHHLDDRVHIG